MIKSKRQNKNRGPSEKEFDHTIARAATYHIEKAMQREIAEKDEQE